MPRSIRMRYSLIGAVAAPPVLFSPPPDRPRPKVLAARDARSQKLTAFAMSVLLSGNSVKVMDLWRRMVGHPDTRHIQSDHVGAGGADDDRNSADNACGQNQWRPIPPCSWNPRSRTGSSANLAPLFPRRNLAGNGVSAGASRPTTVRGTGQAHSAFASPTRPQQREADLPAQPHFT